MTTVETVERYAARQLIENAQNVQIGRTTGKADIIGQMTEALRAGRSLREGLHGIEIRDSVARYFRATESPDKSTFDDFRETGLLVQTVSALDETATVDYHGIASRFYKTWIGNLERLATDGSDPRFGL